MMRTVDGLWSLVRADLQRYGYGVSWRAFLRQYLLAPGFRYSCWMRLTNSLKAMGAPGYVGYVCSRIILHHYSIKYGIDMPYNATIGPGLYISHCGGIVVSEDVVIGRDCNLNHEVTIGVKYGGKNPGCPTIGDRVYLGPGCKVIGGIVLGNDVAVGANAVVVHSLPDFAVAAGIPAKVLSLVGSSQYVVNTTHQESSSS